ncbi:MAG: hypothetical protein KatS3mg085_649 [Candidatus Dojkabacteria bacterium]|nr:MAG: hypothetical protein KatS3mg085_649 [Candidatus Dojkabacteria bacterium]
MYNFEKHISNRKTMTEYWLGNFNTVEVYMNQQGQFANEGEILVTNGLNGCVALIVRAEMPDGKVKGFLAHKHLDKKRIHEFLNDLKNGNLLLDAKLYGTILYPGNEHGLMLSLEAETIQEEIQQKLINNFAPEAWYQLRSVRYAIYRGFPGSVNSNRLAYNISANMWVYREGADLEHPLSGLLKHDK